MRKRESDSVESRINAFVPKYSAAQSEKRAGRNTMLTKNRRKAAEMRIRILFMGAAMPILPLYLSEG
jgi:hypothetical protein